ncbi:three-finger toxin MALT0070C-like [Toxotes jaculatrix]|uniref:three-finger toxin MALT0070C-like n=1 Tax=Toxotes jaculatrix TaxID=941984 RepID=UPI001B3ABDEA|nr:three-finger toxin MALT0070C-like [Toxotes jaculatrix]
MRLCVSLVFICTMLSAVYGLKCYTCWGDNPGTCHNVWLCPEHYDRCATTIVAQNLISKHCMRSDMCDNVYSVGVRCCAEDLCNGAEHAGIFVPLLLAPLAIITLFI